MEIKNYQDGDEIKILELFRSVFHRDMSMAYWQWRFTNNPAGKHCIYLMWDKDKLVGHYAVSPVVMVIDNQKVLTALSMTTMTHPDYGRRGIFANLAIGLYDWIEREKGIKAVWGFPNTNSHYGFVSNLDWKNVGVVHEIGIPSENLKHFAKTGCSLGQAFTEEHIALLETVSTSSIHVDKNLSYLMWRYNENPSQKYQIINYQNENGVLEGFMVVKKYINMAGANFVNVMEVGCKADLTKLGALLNFAIEHFGDNIQMVTMWMSLFDGRYSALEKIGFQPSGHVTYLGYKTLIDGLDSLQYMNNWGISFGDSDVY